MLLCCILDSESSGPELEEAQSSSEEKMVMGLSDKSLMLSGSDLVSKRSLTVFSRGVRGRVLVVDGWPA